MEIAVAFDYNRVKEIGLELLIAIGEDPTRPGLVDTPRRFADAWREFMVYEPGKTDTAFESITTDQMLVIKGMRVWSLCEHHLLPFFCDVSIAYITRSKVLGLSKFGRIAKQHSHKLQIQERLVDEISQDVQRLTGSQDVAVMASGEHLCMTMRGVQLPAKMISSSLNGVFRLNRAARQEFLALIA